MLKTDSTKANNKNEEKNSVLVKSEPKTTSHSSRKQYANQARNHQALKDQNATTNSVDSNETRLSLLVKAAEKVDSGDMSSLNGNSINNNSKLNELSAFLNTNSSILESQQQSSMYGGNGGLTIVQQQQQNTSVPLFIGKNGKPTRPFKAYPKESLSIPIVGSGNSSASATISEIINNQPSLLTNHSHSQHTTNASSMANNQTVLLSTTVNTLASLLSQQQHQQINNIGNSTLGNNGLTQGPLIPPETILSLLQSLITTSAVATATGSVNQPSLSHSFQQPNNTSSISSIDHNIGGISGNLSDLSLLYSGIQAGLGDDSTNSLNNIYNPNDFCVQHRKRIQQAQERLMQKLAVNSATSSSSSTSLLLSQLTDLISTPASASSNMNTNGTSFSTNSLPSRRRSSIGSKRCSSSESNSSPVANNSCSNNQHNNMPVSNKEKRVETPDTTTSDLVQDNGDQMSNQNPLPQDQVKQPKDSKSSLNQTNLQQDEYLNYPPKKRHKIITIEQTAAENNNSIEETSGDDPKSQSQSQSPTINEQPLNRINNESNSAAVASTAEVCENLLSRSNKSNSGTPPSVTAQRFSSVSSTRSRNSSIDDSGNGGSVNTSVLNTDEAYRERRRKNNEAAKRSRDARRAKEDDIALRAALLERENLQLKVELAQLKQETNRLRCLLYNS